MNDSTLPGCIGLEAPIPPNKCETCRYTELCKRVIHKDRLKSVLEAIENIEATLKG